VAVRRLPEDEQIIFIRNLKPARALKAGYHEVTPWRDQVQPNRMYGGARFIGKLKMRIVGARAIATRAGRRSPDKVRLPIFRPLFAVATTLLQGSGLLFARVLVASILVFGWPHLRIEYAANGTGLYRSYVWCRYFGPPFVTEPFTLNGEHCPLLLWKKLEGGEP
jgi:type IV secretion system protein VirD4